MTKSEIRNDTVRASRAGHTFHERWAARRALQLIFPKDGLFSIVVEGLSPFETIKPGKEAEDIADLTLFYGDGDSFANCSTQQILQFKYKASGESVTASYLKKTIEKFSKAAVGYETATSREEMERKLTFGFITNAELSADLWDAISCLKDGGTPKTQEAKRQLEYLESCCHGAQNVEAQRLFPLIEFRAGTSDLPSQNRQLRRTISDWSADSEGKAKTRLFALVELLREKAGLEGQRNNTIRREDVLDRLECDEDLLFPADTRFVDVGEIVEREALADVQEKICSAKLPIFLHAEGGVGKTVFVQSLAAGLSGDYEVVVFDCFGGGAYRAESQARHLPRVGLLQIINELAARGLCDPLLPSDSDEYGLIRIARKRLQQASQTVRDQSSQQGVLIILDAADNAQLEADRRGEKAFPHFLLSSLSEEPIEGVKLLLTARPHRMDRVIGRSAVERIGLQPFSIDEATSFLIARREKISDVEFSMAFARSDGNARVLDYLVNNWDQYVLGNSPDTKITVEEIIAEQCQKIFDDLDVLGWPENEIKEFFAAISLLPPPIPLDELAKALDWTESQVNSAASDLAPMLEIVRQGAIFRDEPTETYISEHYANEVTSRQAIAQRLLEHQKDSVYAAESLPHFLVVIGDSDKAFQLARSEDYPAVIDSEYGRRRLKQVRLFAAYCLAVRENDLDRALSLTMQLSQAASANAKGDQFIRRSPALAAILGDNDTSRRLFNDRSGWRGARDTRLTVAHCFLDEIDEAKIHQKRAIGWINWYLNIQDKDERHNRPRLKTSDLAAVLFASILRGEYFSFNRNIQIWNDTFALQVIEELILLCAEHEATKGSDVLQKLAEFAASKRCLSLSLQIGLLSSQCSLQDKQLKAIARAAGTLAARYKKKADNDPSDYKMVLQDAIAQAAIFALLTNSKLSARQILKLCDHRKPSGYDYADHHRQDPIRISLLSCCVSAWSSGSKVAYHHLIPKDGKAGNKTKEIDSRSALNTYLDSLETVEKFPPRKNKRAPKKKKLYSSREREEIVNGIEIALKLVKVIETAIFSRTPITNQLLKDFIEQWKSTLRPDVHWRSEDGSDNLARHFGMGLAKILLRLAVDIEREAAENLIKIVQENRFALSEKLDVLGLFARRPNLNDVSGTFAKLLSDEILKDESIEQRGELHRSLAEALIPMSVAEAKEYYKQGLGQLDQMGGDDFELMNTTFLYAAEQTGGYIQPELSQRLMNLSQAIFHYEPSKFWWTLFGRASAASIGIPAIYKLIRWDDQDVAEFSYGLPQLACFLASTGALDARRAAILMTICKDQGWHEWKIGDGLVDLLRVARPEDRRAIFLILLGKLEAEYTFGGWESLWKGLVDCVDAYKEIDDDDIRKRLQSQLDAVEQKRGRERERSTGRAKPSSDVVLAMDQVVKAKLQEDTFQEISSNCDPALPHSIDSAIIEIENSELDSFQHRKRLFAEIFANCPYDKRLPFAEAVCEVTELEFDESVDLLVECIEHWGATTAHLKAAINKLIEKLFAFKGSGLFELRYSNTGRQIYRLTELSGDQKFVTQQILKSIAKEKLELSGDEWLQVATSLCTIANPATARTALEDLLSSSSAKIGDEIGEGRYRKEFAGSTTEPNLIADILWHLLGDEDAYMRWNVAKSIKHLAELGLTDDIACLLERFSETDIGALSSKEHHFSFWNAQQWLLMGLARAATDHGEKLLNLTPAIEELLKQRDLHVICKMHALRCLTNILGEQSLSAEYLQLRRDILSPPVGIVVRDDWPRDGHPEVDFDLDYDFEKYEVSGLARLFGISRNAATAHIGIEVTKRWPETKSMRDFPGGVRYNPGGTDNRFESYREHIQKHALLHAATTLVQSQPLVRKSYESNEYSPWSEWLKKHDVSFPDGSWLSDHKDAVPTEARRQVLGERVKNQEVFLPQESLLSNLGFTDELEQNLVPLYGCWKTREGAYIKFLSALVEKTTAERQCVELSKKPEHELWLPMFESDGYEDRFSSKVRFQPFICDPESYPIGIDEGDKLATRRAISRPRLGVEISKAFKLKPDEDSRDWRDENGNLALRCYVWGEWIADQEARRQYIQDDGALLWADRQWLDSALKTLGRSLAYKISFSLYKRSRDYDDSSDLKATYVGLKSNEEPFKFWHAKKASENPDEEL